MVLPRGRLVVVALLVVRSALGEHGAKPLQTVEGLRGAIVGPGDWYGETPLDQYGMVTIRLARPDRSEPDRVEFEQIIAAVIDDVIAAAPAVPW